MGQYLSIDQPEDLTAEEKRGALQNDPTLGTIAKMIKSGQISRICIMAGAGISVSAGIPDFRSPGTGLYSNLQSYDLPSPEAVFDIGFFKENLNSSRK